LDPKVEKDLSDSSYDFLRVVCPKLKAENLISGELMPVESVTAEGMRKALDALAGIDIWQIKNSKGMRGIANRIQWGPKAWDTFTIRKTRITTGAKTEYEKRIEAITTRAWLYPYFTCQAYITKRRTGLLSLAIAKTETIFEMINQGLCWEKTNNDDGNIFICVDWFNVKKFAPEDIKIWPSE